MLVKDTVTLVMDISSSDINNSNIDKIIEDEVGFVFEKVLEDCVFCNEYQLKGSEVLKHQICFSILTKIHSKFFLGKNTMVKILQD